LGTSDLLEVLKRLRSRRRELERELEREAEEEVGGPQQGSEDLGRSVSFKVRRKVRRFKSEDEVVVPTYPIHCEGRTIRGIMKRPSRGLDGGTRKRGTHTPCSSARTIETVCSCKCSARQFSLSAREPLVSDHIGIAINIAEGEREP